MATTTTAARQRSSASDLRHQPILQIWSYSNTPPQYRELFSDVRDVPVIDAWVAHVPPELADASLLNLLSSNDRAPALETIMLADGGRVILGCVHRD